MVISCAKKYVGVPIYEKPFARQHRPPPISDTVTFQESMSHSACTAVSAASHSPLCLTKASRRAVSCHAKLPRDAVVNISTPTPQRTRSGSMIRSLAAAVELNSQVQRYETLAGRSAMVGVAAAVCIELITDHSVFYPVNSNTAIMYACVALATLASSVGIALAKGRSDSPIAGTGVDILEAVYASLTAVKRSAASVTQAQVDKAVDYVLETVLEGRFDSFSIEGLLLTSEDDC
ncbi:hypothetical protein VaNZ11_012553 [Volvox africanus]|uniref:SMODS and SLOG-associating 2TM effector domain-containing protein n=1 Tax=Volvox africanus TaxID=51714 RepID=A0ABQ5SFN3_9CHLO|nr:hypothetical protein VaNZ11_012553 [Volvox africanus]